MEVRVFDTAEQVGQAAAALFAAQLIAKPQSVLGLATGSSPVKTYQNLIDLNQKGVVDFSRCTTYNLDEYVGIAEDHVCSYHRFMDDNLFHHVNVRPGAVHVPDGNAGDLAAAAAAYDAAIAAAGGVDVQLLGIGHNGHIGFNEPDDHFTYGCHVVALTESTIKANTRFFNSEDEVPKQAISLGIGSIMAAKRVVLIATGKDKAPAVQAAVQGEVTPRCPASILRTHPDVIFLLDKAAASLL